jgi:hypothetical protein
MMLCGLSICGSVSSPVIRDSNTSPLSCPKSLWDQKAECTRKCFVNGKRLIKCKGLLLQWERQEANKMDLVAVSTGITFCFFKEREREEGEREKGKKRKEKPAAASTARCTV